MAPCVVRFSDNGCAMRRARNVCKALYGQDKHSTGRRGATVFPAETAFRTASQFTEPNNKWVGWVAAAGWVAGAAPNADMCELKHELCVRLR